MVYDDYWTSNRTIMYVDKTVNRETCGTHALMAKLATSAQEQLDELFVNHVAVPGLINLTRLEEPITGFKL